MRNKIRHIWSRYFIVITALAVCSLSACGGDSSTTKQTTQPVVQKLTGVAAGGQSIAGGTVTLKDSASPANVKTTTTDANGNYAFDVTGLTPPFIIKVTWTAGATTNSLCSVATAPGVANVNPMTDLVVANAAGVTNANNVFDNPTSYTKNLTDTNINNSITAVKTFLKPLLEENNAMNVNPLTDPFEANSKGLDAVLDAIVIDVNKDTGEVNIKDKQTNIVIGQASTSIIPNVPIIDIPKNITATAGSKQNTITWDAVRDATSYNIYWSNTPGVTKDKSTKISNATSPYTHTGLGKGTKYYYVVAAVVGDNEGSAGQEVSATTTITADDIPANVKTTAGNKQNSVTWDTVQEAASYNIYWSTTPGVTTANGTKISGVTSPYVHTNLTNGTTYYYIVTAVFPAAESVASSQASATPSLNPPPPPAN